MPWQAESDHGEKVVVAVNRSDSADPSTASGSEAVCAALLSRAQERTATAGVFSPTPWGSEAGLLPDHQQISDTDDLEFEFEFESEFELESESEPESD